MTREAHLFEGKIKLLFPYDKELIDELKVNLLGRKWVQEGKFWMCENVDANHKWLLDKDFKFKFSLPEKFKFTEWPRLKATLRQYQIEGIEDMVNWRKCINGIFPGGGKTIQALTATDIIHFNYGGAYPVLAITKASLKENMKREWAKFLPDVSVQILDNQTDPIKGMDVYIVNYDIIKGEKEKDDEKIEANGIYKFIEKLKPKTFIIDESHRLKNGKAGRTKYISKLVKKIKPKNMFLLTGTVIKNRPIEALEQIKLIDKVDVFGGPVLYMMKFCGATDKEGHLKKNRWGGIENKGASNLEELHRIMTSTFYFRRERSDVLAELPPITDIDLWVNVKSPEYILLENDLIELMKDRGDMGREIRLKIFTMSNEEREYFIENELPKHYSKSQGDILGKLGAMRRQLSEDKLSFAVEWINDFLEESDESLLVFGIHRLPLIYLSKEFDADLINGSTPPPKRQLMVDRIQKGEKRILFLNQESGGEGLNITKASTILNLELPWTDSDIEQVRSRIHRIGNTNEKLTMYHLLAEESTDEYAHLLLRQKKTVLDAVNRGVFDNLSSLDMQTELVKFYFRKAMKMEN